YNQYSVRVRERDVLAEHMKQQGVQTEIYYPLPLHRQQCFAYLGYREGSLQHAEAVAREVLALPCYPELTPQMQSYVADTVLNGVAMLQTV
ncbi:MAG: DegT/DnrJ/EryC1/StrS family aminotransferase, partial [Acidobacteriaceae bacterium]